MVMTSADLFDRGLDVFGGVVEQVPPGGWDRPTECDGWTALDVLGHLCTSLGMGISVLKGEAPSWPQLDRPADLIEGDPVAFWTALAGEARSSLEGADLELEMDTPMGPSTVAQRLAFPAIDLFVHAWDIGHAVGVDVAVPEDAIEFAHAYIDPIPADKVRGPGGAFGPAVDVPTGASPTEAFIAWTGRAPR